MSVSLKQMRVALNSGRQQLLSSCRTPGSLSRARWYATQNLAKGGRPFAYTWLTKTAEETVSKINLSELSIFKLNDTRHQMIFCPGFLQRLWAQLQPLLSLSFSLPQASPTGLILLALSSRNSSVAFTETHRGAILSMPLQPWLIHSQILQPKTQIQVSLKGCRFWQ